MSTKPTSQNLIGRPQKNPFTRYRILHFLSSVKLAVPLMLAIGVVVAIGTLYESRYNAQVASLLVYRSLWFQGLLCLLWINIFCSTLSRWPYQKHHLGFLVTHVGLLTLLVGSLMTLRMGIDGQLRVVEHTDARQVYLPELIVKTSLLTHNGSRESRSTSVSRQLEAKTGEQIGLQDFFQGTGLIVDRYLPYVSVKGGEQFSSPGVVLEFNIKSAMFDVNQSMHSVERPEMQMGPATFKLRVGKNTVPASAVRRKEMRSPQAVTEETQRSQKSGQNLVIFQGDRIVKRVNLQSVKLPHTIDLGAFKVEITKRYQNAAVAQGKLVERNDSGSNPALEFYIIHQGNRIRDITFAKYPGFSIQQKQVSDFKFEYHVSGTPQAAPESSTVEKSPVETTQSPHAEHAGVPSEAPVGAGNEIHFRVDPEKTDHAQVTLYKGGKLVLDQSAKIGEAIQTPWMGMVIRLDKINAGTGGAAPASGPIVEAIPLPAKTQMPPSAIHFRSYDQPSGEGFWLVENSEVSLTREKGELNLYYGMDSIELPFSVYLESFRKMDYPGTETAMSFESTIRVAEGTPTVVKMNEPLARDGYVLYQSSYEMGPGMQTASIFSVNRDPGRWVKYIGAIVLSIGIVLFTLMRSEWYLAFERKRKKAKNGT